MDCPRKCNNCQTGVSERHEWTFVASTRHNLSVDVMPPIGGAVVIARARRFIRIREKNWAIRVICSRTLSPLEGRTSFPSYGLLSLPTDRPPKCKDGKCLIRAVSTTWHHRYLMYVEIEKFSPLSFGRSMSRINSSSHKTRTTFSALFEYISRAQILAYAFV